MFTIRLLKLILDAIWYLMFIFLITIAGFVLTGNSSFLPFFTTEITLDSTGIEGDIVSNSTNSSIVNWNPKWNLPLNRDNVFVPIKPPNILWTVLHILVLAFSMLLMLTIVYLLRRLFRVSNSRSSSMEEIVKRMRQLGIVIFFGYLADVMLVFVLQNYLNTIVTTRGFTIRTGFHPTYLVLFLGLLMVALSELFRRNTVENTNSA